MRFKAFGGSLGILCIALPFAATSSGCGLTRRDKDEFSASGAAGASSDSSGSGAASGSGPEASGGRDGGPESVGGTEGVGGADSSSGGEESSPAGGAGGEPSASAGGFGGQGGSGAEASTYCEKYVVSNQLLICEDFDTNPLGDAWTTVTQAEKSPVLSEDAVSAPYSGMFFQPDGDNGGSFLYRSWQNLGPASLRVAFTIKLSAACIQESDFLFTKFASLSLKTQDGYRSIDLGSDGQSLILRDQYDEHFLQDFALQAGEWLPMTLEIHSDHLLLQVDDSSTLEVELADHLAALQKLDANIGVGTYADWPGECAVQYDNIVIEKP